MTGWTLIRNSLRHHWRSHLGTFLGAAIGSAVLIGALIVGDSVRESLKDKARERLGRVTAVVHQPDKFFTEDLVARLNARIPNRTNLWSALPQDSFADVLTLPAVVRRSDGAASANRVSVFGIRTAELGGAPTLRTLGLHRLPAVLAPDEVWLNDSLARQLGVAVGDGVILRLHKPSALSLDAPISPRDDQSIALRLKVGGLVPAKSLGNFALTQSATPPLNAFLDLKTLQNAVGKPGRVNLLATGWPKAEAIDSQAPPESTLGRTVAGFFIRLGGLNVPGLRNWIFSQFGVTSAGFSLDLAELESHSFRGMLSPWSRLDDLLGDEVRLTDEGLSVREGRGSVLLESDQIFFDRPSSLPLPATAPPEIPVLTYLVNGLRAGTNLTPYSMVTAAGAPYTQVDLADDEILVTRWLADDLGLKPGDFVALEYFDPESSGTLIERTNRFRVRSVVEPGGIHDDRTLMPNFPGVAKAESTKEWDAGFPLTHKIRDKDEAYWNQFKGTPKAFVSFAAGQKMWRNRWGSTTSVRWLPENQSVVHTLSWTFQNAKPRATAQDAGPWKFHWVQASALKAAGEGQDFGGLFIGFSFFLIAAALILMSMLFQFGLEQRAAEIGTLLAVGWRPRKVRRLLLGEGVALALIGGIAGAFGGAYYARAMITGLNTLWNDAVGGASLGFHLMPGTVVTGVLAGTVVAAITLWLALRKQGRRSARELLAEGGVVEDFADKTSNAKSGKAPVLAVSCLVLALVAVGAATMLPDQQAQGGAFFGGGSLLLIGGILLASWWLRRAVGRTSRSGEAPIPHLSMELTLPGLASRSIARRRKRSLATIALLASGSFLIVAVGANRLDATRDATKRSAGTGGFAFIGESSLPIVEDPNAERGRENLNLPDKPLQGVSFVPLRVKDGDEASCLNLGRAQQPRLLGVDADLLANRGAFTFTALAKGFSGTNGWLALTTESWSNGAFEGSSIPSLQTSNTPPVPVVPAIGDANSIQWAMGKKVGDTLDYVDERGQPFKVRIVGAVANSILQGQLLIDEAAFKARFPSISGYRMFLVDAPSDTATNVAASLSRALQDYGLELTPTATRLNQFNAVQNTYLGTFQILGGLGLLLGSAGLGVVVLRNVLERLTELAVLKAVGFRGGLVRGLVLREHVTLLWAGLGLGVLSALIGVIPALRPGSEMPWGTLGLTLLAILANGFLWTWLATRFAMRGQLLDALRNP